MKRREFISNTGAIAAIILAPSLDLLANIDTGTIVTVTGKISPDKLGSTLVHEHILVDFIGSDQVSRSRYNADEVFNKALPYLLSVKRLGCDTLVECTPAFLGRNVSLLRRLSEASGIQIITNTGYYGAVKGKYLPSHAFDEDAMQISRRWIREWVDGIDNSGIFPGFIKLGVDDGPLKDVDKKMLKAAALAHLETGLTISGHTGDGVAVFEEIAILEKNGVSPEAFRWVHAQNEKNMDLHANAAARGAWIEFDGISPESIQEHVAMLKSLKNQNLLQKVLVSHDAGWYSVGEEKGGDFRSYNTLYEEVIPLLRKEGFKEEDIHQILVLNPAESFRIGLRSKQ